MDVIKNKLHVSINLSDIERSHRVGKCGTSGNNKPRPIILKFVSYRIREQIFRQKKKLKGSKLSIKEDVTKARAQILGRLAVWVWKCMVSGWKMFLAESIV